jgi:hypothetical protein
MKRLLIICALMGARVSHGQTISVMAGQVAELKVFEHTLGKGYQLMTAGLDSIGGITDDEYQLHLAYFQSLGVIKPNLDEDAVVVALRNLQAALVQRLNERLAYWKSQQTIQ